MLFYKLRGYIKVKKFKYVITPKHTAYLRVLTLANEVTTSKGNSILHRHNLWSLLQKMYPKTEGLNCEWEYTGISGNITLYEGTLEDYINDPFKYVKKEKEKVTESRKEL